MADEWEVVEYGKGDERFKRPEFEGSISHVLLFMFAILTLGSQVAMTMGILPSSFWPITVASFLGALASYVWVYFAMERRSEA